MRLFYIRKVAVVSALGLVTILGMSEIANAQGRSRDNDRRGNQKQQEQIRKQNAKIQEGRARAEQKRQAEWAKQNQRILANQRQQDARNRRVTPSGNDRSNGNGYYNGNANANTNRNNRYRVYRNGSYYNTDQRGADILRQAVNAGYQQGFQAGRSDRSRNRNASWTNSNVYQNGTYGYQSHVNRSQYQYYFRQGFQRGYQDGSNVRYQENYNGQYQYGYDNNGSRSILGAILGQILNIQTY